MILKEIENAYDGLLLLLRDVGRHQVLSREEETALGRRSIKGDPEAIELLVNCNLRLVVVIAKEYLHRGLRFRELMLAGMLGLLRAAQKFDPSSHQAKFSTYAAFWIRWEMLLDIHTNASLVKYPLHTRQLAGRVRRMRENGIGSDDEVLSLTGVSRRALSTAKELLKFREESLSAPLIDGEMTMEDWLPDDRAFPPSAILMDTEKEEALLAALSFLPDYQAYLISSRFALGGSSLTLEQLGSCYSVTKELIRLNEATCLKFLRNIFLKHGADWIIAAGSASAARDTIARLHSSRNLPKRLTWNEREAEWLVGRKVAEVRLRKRASLTA